MRHLWIRALKPFADLETNKQTQLTVHKHARRFWLLNVPVVIYLVIWESSIWLRVGLLMTVIYSLYANWSDDDAAVSAIEASINTDQTADLMEGLADTDHHHGDERG